ncbi:MAG TPA: hypothetical protein VGL72_00220, partial [Bryobacteraceae bacterium]
LVLGNSTVRASAVGTPSGMTADSTGAYAASDYVTKSGAVTSFNSISPYTNVSGTISGLPSGQCVYIAEAATPEFSLPPFSGSSTYAFGLF